MNGSSDSLGLLCVHAHPDDEAIVTGGVLRKAALAGHRTAVVTCTGGERGEIHNMDPDEVGPRLAEVRREELARALAILGAGEPRFLGYVDSGMMGTDGNSDPASFWQASVDEAVSRLVRTIRAFRPDVFVTYDAFGGYGHPDHIQTHRVGLLAAEAASIGALYPDAGPPWRPRKVYLQTMPRTFIALAANELAAHGLYSPFPAGVAPEELPFGTDDELISCTVDVRDFLDDKLAALNAHVSQLAPDSFFLNIPEGFRERAFGQEWFVRLRSDVRVPDLEEDLFTGL